MKKKTIYRITGTILLSTFVLIACSNTSDKNNSNQTKKGIELNWILSDNDSLIYKTVMNQIGESSFEMDYGGLFDKTTDNSKVDTEKFGKDFLKNLKTNTIIQT